MRLRAIPSRASIAAVAVLAAGLLAALISGVAVATAARIGLVVSLALAALGVLDYVLTLKAW